MTKTNKGFTLIELLIVIAILAILAFIITPNLLSSLKKGRDAKRKGDLGNVQKALEMYYEDRGVYPLQAGVVFDAEFSVGGKVYMIRLPQDPSAPAGYRYYYCPSTDSQSYQLYASLENTQDPQVIDPFTCGTSNCGTNHTCNYGISSPNSTP